VRLERTRLRETVRQIEQQLKRLENIPRYYGDDLVEQSVDEIRQQQQTRLRKAKPSPYFGRLDFLAEGASGVESLYIGKVGVQDERNGDIVVVDWRAPISSIFYAFSGAEEEVSYRSPDGMETGVVHLKRNLAIENGQLIRMVDSYVRGQSVAGLADEFLLYRLAEHKDAKLRDIVSTIQAEQDRVIRGPQRRVMFIQGVAGSGKTTVALHRLAYLLYEYQNSVRPEKMMVFAPTRMFLGYIADVLPELGVGDIPQTTFVDWAATVLKVPVTVQSNANRYGNWFEPFHETTPEDELACFKGSLECRKWLKDFVDNFLRTFVPTVHVTFWNGCVVRAETVADWFYHEYRHLAPNVRRERVLARLKRYFETRYKEMQEYDGQKTLRKAALAALRAYSKAWMPMDVVKVYNAALAEHPAFNQVVKPIRKSGKAFPVHPEDLAPLLWLQDTMYGLEGQAQFHHVVLDESQDFSPFQLSVLASRIPSRSCTILGDLSQSIFPYHGVQSWNDLMDAFEDAEADYFELNRSYRSTTEIVQFANDIIARHCTTAPAVPVFRSGRAVRVLTLEENEMAIEILNLVVEAKENGAQSIAVLTRTETGARCKWQLLKEAGLDIRLMDGDNDSYQGGISILPIFVSKGLEFDAVIVADVTAEQFPDDALSARLLYVACTRALHMLYIVSTTTISPLLAG